MVAYLLCWLWLVGYITWTGKLLGTQGLISNNFKYIAMKKLRELRARLDINVPMVIRKFPSGFSRALLDLVVRTLPSPLIRKA